jgi:hypothetical protein
MAEVQTLRVKVHPEQLAKSKVGLWDKNPAHKQAGNPEGEVFVAGEGEWTVADTTEVRTAIQEKRIVEVRGSPEAKPEPESRAPAETDKPGPMTSSSQSRGR